MSDLSGAKVLILMGSKSDWPTMAACSERLDEIGVPHAVHVASAHRSPRRVETLVREAEAAGVGVLIAAAGMAAHLAGAVAAQTTRPVIGVPMASSPLQGFDALLSTVQMPPGMPVLTMAVGKPGAINAAEAAAQILALADADLASRLETRRRALPDKIAEQDDQLSKERRKS
ncbi:5-(carboxyamino)imidazole ribonucleotide mutase [Candidatus Sumerlaeota bacterium]|nr:5-(carboxyamino)imidazole ribonucleotide mutase [Candidatus Sumerlaeota bacterium]